MDVNNKNIADLILKKLAGSLSKQEQHILQTWISESELNRQLVDDFEADKLFSNIHLFSKARENVWQVVVDAIHLGEAKKVKRFGIVKRLVIAASLLGIISTFSYVLLTINRGVARNEKSQQHVDDVLAPQNSLAYIILNDNRKVRLDSLQHGISMPEGAIDIRKLNNEEVAYAKRGKESVFNTIVNPKGSKLVSLILSDGTKVWLNTCSSLRYPLAFTGNAREVQMEGEAYFEVAHRNNMPFYVKSGSAFVKVLGTQFNVNAYNDNEPLAVTLMEGNVIVSNDHDKVELKPGQQAVLSGKFKIMEVEDMSVIAGWKEELFIYKGASLRTIMKEVARWYDLDVEYEGEIKERFYFEVSRRSNVSSVISILESMAGMHLKLTGKTIRVIKKEKQG